MNRKSSVPDGLEARFTEPRGFRWHRFERNGRMIRFGSVFPQDSIPDAVVVCLPGLSEYGEKYFEVARDLNARNLAFWVIDWMGQGGSGRYLADPEKRHAARFEEDIEDLHYLYLEYIKHSSVHPDVGRIPLAMLGHSMGGNIGLRYMQKYPDTFECAGFSAPMLHIHSVDTLPLPLAAGIASALSLFAGSSYGPAQGGWEKSIRAEKDRTLFSSDPARSQLHDQWLHVNPDLRVGGVTNRWIYEALRSCRDAARSMKAIKKDMFIGLASQEAIVSNKTIRHTFASMAGVHIREFPEAAHEILMETDAVRGAFLHDFYDLIRKSILDRPETLKPF